MTYLKGCVFGSWKVIRHAYTKRGNDYWICLCKCGNEGCVYSGKLIKGLSTKCMTCANRRPSKYKNYKELTAGVWGEIERVAKKRNKEFLITQEEAYELFQNQHGKCALTGLEILLGQRGNRSASLDRIDSNNPYVKSNCQWVHKDVNMMKWNLDQSYFINLCKLIAEKFKV